MEQAVAAMQTATAAQDGPIAEDADWWRTKERPLEPSGPHPAVDWWRTKEKPLEPSGPHPAEAAPRWAPWKEPEPCPTALASPLREPPASDSRWRWWEKDKRAVADRVRSPTEPASLSREAPAAGEDGHGWSRASGWGAGADCEQRPLVRASPSRKLPAAGEGRGGSRKRPAPRRSPSSQALRRPPGMPAMMPPGGLSWLKPESPEQARQPQEQEQDLGWLQLKGPEGGATMAAVIYMGGKKSPSFYAAENVLHAVAGIWDVDINSTLFDADVKAALLKHPTLHEYATSFLVAKHGRFLDATSPGAKRPSGRLPGSRSPPRC
jgi:hypothetical protein